MQKNELILSNDNFSHIYSDMLTQFPKSELKSKEHFEKLLKTPSYKAYTIKICGVSAGYVVMFVDKKNKTLWLDYIAVFKEQHSKGYGTRIFEIIKEEFSDFFGIWLEVEKPDDEVLDTLRRIKFYKKLGARLVCENYIYPNNDGGLPMDLYFLPFCNGNCEEKMHDCIKEVFNVVHIDVKDCDLIFKAIKKRS